MRKRKPPTNTKAKNDPTTDKASAVQTKIYYMIII